MEMQRGMVMMRAIVILQRAKPAIRRVGEINLPQSAAVHFLGSGSETLKLRTKKHLEIKMEMVKTMVKQI
jgi:O-acetylhomoserine/O-acetylserine sulfhydrylase-like pyridoxal-dependent enzyme